MAYSIGKKISDQLIKVEVNDFGDYIVLNPADVSIQAKFAAFLKWMETKEKEMSTLADEATKKYEGRKVVTEKDGETEVDVEQLTELIDIQAGFYKECVEQIEGLFGQDALKKYFRVCYEVNPDFLPDQDYISDFLEEITPVLNEVYNAHFERAKGRYNRNRKGKNTKVTPITEEARVEDKVEKGDE